jgi:hypothetical protein
VLRAADTATFCRLQVFAGLRPRSATPRWLLVATCLALGLLSPPVAAGQEGDFQSELRTVRPGVPGLELEVLGGDERLKLRNRTGRTVVVEGYDKEPYLRFGRNGKVEQNRFSPATYLNKSRYEEQEVPLEAIPENEPDWKRIAAGGAYSWFDHRIHFTTRRPPPKDGERRKIFDWTVPLSVDGQRVQALGTFSWEPTSDGFPVWLAVLLAALALLTVAALVLWRRRPHPAGAGKPEEEPGREAW